MPFPAEFLYKASKQIELKSLEQNFTEIRAFIEKALERVAQQTPNVRLGDVNIYMHGSYVNKTNISMPSNIEIMVELTKTINYNPAELTPNKYRLFNNYFVNTALDFTPKDFRKLFSQALIEEVGENSGAKEQNKSIEFRQIGKVRHKIDITPCFSFHHTNDKGEVFKGVMIYDKKSDANIISFPRIHAQNGHAKDLATQGNFKKCVRLFKTIYALMVRDELADKNLATGYFIECLLFNVPNNLFITFDRGAAFNNLAPKVNRPTFINATIGEINSQSNSNRTTNIHENQGIFNSSNTTETDETPSPLNPNRATAHIPSNRTFEELDSAALFTKVFNYLMHADLKYFACQNLVWSLFGNAAEFWSISNAEQFLSAVHTYWNIIPSEEFKLGE